jgi:hypothetical protein
MFLILYSVDVNFPCYVGPCHHGMARPTVADGGEGLQITGRQLRT